MMVELYLKVKLKDGRIGVVVERLGSDFVIDLGTSPDDWDTIIVHEKDIETIMR